jgi:predicted lipoprotein with Yx(FWY)xxD motif
MKNIPRIFTAALLAGLLLTTTVALAEHHTVKIAKKEGVGSFLVDSKGLTLYYFKKDTPGKSACEGECVARWPLYFREAVAARDGLKAENFGTITRADGQKQTNYKGMPLYYFAGDKAPGETTGQGAGNVWYVANP